MAIGDILPEVEYLGSWGGYNRWEATFNQGEEDEWSVIISLVSLSGDHPPKTITDPDSYNAWIAEHQTTIEIEPFPTPILPGATPEERHQWFKDIEAAAGMIIGDNLVSATAHLHLVNFTKGLSVGAEVIDFNDYYTVVQSTGGPGDAISTYIGRGGHIVAGSNALAASPAQLIDIGLYQTPQAIGVGQVISVSYPIFIGSALPQFDIAAAPEFYEDPAVLADMEEALSEYSTPGSKTIQGIVAADGSVYFNKEAVEAVVNIAIERGYEPDRKYTQESPDEVAPNGVASIGSYVAYTSRRTSSGTVEGFVRMRSRTMSNPELFEKTPNTATLIVSVGSSGTALTAIYAYDSHIDGLGQATYTKDGRTVYYSTYTVNNTKEDGGVSFQWVKEHQSFFVNEYNGLLTTEQIAESAWNSVFQSTQLEQPVRGLSPYGGAGRSGRTIEVVGDVDDLDNLTEYVEIQLPSTTLDPDSGMYLPVNPGTTPHPPDDAIPDFSPYIPNEVSPSQYPPEVEVPTDSERDSGLITGDAPEITPNPPQVNPSAEPADSDDNDTIDENSSSGESPNFIPPFPQFDPIFPINGPGMIHVYHPTVEEFCSFASWLWVSWTTPGQATIWNNPFDGVIGAHEIYCSPVDDTEHTIRCGFLTCPTTAHQIRQRYTTINCGNVIVPERFRNYLDYSPYSNCKVYLPFVGIVDVDVDDIVGHAVNITYHIDTYNGACIAQITVARPGYTNTIYEFNGNCASDIPLSGGSQGSIRGGMLQGLASALSGVVTGAAALFAGNPVTAIGSAVGGIANGYSAFVNQKSTVQHSGTFGGSYGAMSIKTPYIILRRPVTKVVPKHGEELGNPAYRRVKLSTCDGFIRCRAAHVVSATATEEEKRMIEEQLTSGVFL